jgi:hypothetical protein
VVSKFVWADIGATCAGSTNRRRHTDILQLEAEIDLFQDGGQIKNKKDINHHNGS